MSTKTILGYIKKHQAIIKERLVFVLIFLVIAIPLTILFIKNVVVRKLTNDGWGTAWTFTVPSEADKLIGHLFDMSLNNAVIDYCIGRNIYSEDLREDIYADVITLVEAKNGYTNITPTLIDAMSQRYEK